ncbi:MAG: bifunctional alpha,alpha-trehalose-phosphate synthase (UDP-forming)/trehalose-phosphatase [Chloroflexota bacterium]|nr:MAG: bifunctional alpha,alpha-trehalose-phosphate synthase (UDP-forming)/trehalose-phosphatase [Chloroflexota bacterium]
MSDRLLVVSNRLPLTTRRAGTEWRADLSSGGLVAALTPVMERARGLWIGWPGDAPSGDTEGRDALLRSWEQEHRFVSVDLPAKITRAFYEGYSNNTIWPLLHGFPTLVSFDRETWHAYLDANERFAAAVIERAKPGDLVWIHDYQLMLVPSLLRAARPDIRIGFFLHVPFPPAEVFRILPQRDEVLHGLLGADLIGFQTHEHLGAFRRTLLQVLGTESRMDRVEVDGRIVALEAHPIGIVTDEWEQLVTTDKGVARRIADLRDRHAGRQLVLAVDRLDYTKGIPERLRAFRHFLLTRPEWRGRVTMIQVAVPSRERIPRYVELRREVSELVGELNGELGTATWNPVIYLRRSVSRSELAALYAAADVAWVASLRDGMNLVAKEFVACQRDRAGVLLLSEFAGAAGEMGEALRINPYDEQGSADALERALKMPEDERRERQDALLARVRRSNAISWAEGFVAQLRTAADDRDLASGPVGEPKLVALRRAYRSAKRRVCYLDYDGTLVPLASRPADAVPSQAVGEIVGSLARKRGTTVVIVSGRPAVDLERWFGHLPSVWLAAEHGALLREPGSTDFQSLRPGAGTEWKDHVRPVLEHFAARAPGSTVEEKDYALAWHYRLVEPEFGTWLSNELGVTLDQQLAGTELAVLRGSKVIEIRYAWANKGEVVSHVRSIGATPDFELAIGDDRTDEDMFDRLPPEAWTVHVGGGQTRARYAVPGPPAAIALIAALAGASSAAERAAD